MGYQQITIMGNLTRDVEVRQVGQSQVAKTAVAVSEKFRKQDGTVGENTEFFDIEIWDKASVYPYLTKGAAVLVVGQQKTERWQDQQGQNREAKKIRVSVVQLCGPRPQQAQGQQAAPAAQAPAPAPAPAQPTYQQAPYQPQGQQMPGYAPVPQPPQPGYAPAPQPTAQAPYAPPQPGGYHSGDPDFPF